MTLMPALPAASSWSLSDPPSIDAMIRTFAPLVIIVLICCTWVGMSLFAYSRSTLYPAFSRSDLTALPSAIQRADTLVGIATLTSAPLLSVLPLEPEPGRPPPEHAASETAMPRATMPTAIFLNFTVIPFERRGGSLAVCARIRPSSERPTDPPAATTVGRNAARACADSVSTSSTPSSSHSAGVGNCDRSQNGATLCPEPRPSQARPAEVVL